MNIKRSVSWLDVGLFAEVARSGVVSTELPCEEEGSPLGCRPMGRFIVGRSRLFAVLAGVVAVSLSLPALAQTDPTEVAGNEMADGTWTGSFTASGTENRSESGIAVTVVIEDSGTLNFTVDRGAASGTFSSSGTNNWQTAAGSTPSLTGSSTLQSGGTIAGDRTNLTGNGNTSQSGTLTIEGSGQTIQRPISSDTAFAFSMTVTGASCEAARGTLSGSFISGTFTAVNSESFAGDDTAAAAERIAGLAEYFGKFIRFMDRMGFSENSGYRQGASREALPIGEFMDLMAEAEAVLNQLRNASACLTLQVGPDRLEEWDNVITHDLAGVLVLASNRFRLTANDVRALTSAALRMGAIGSGARNSEAAAVGEEAMRGWAEVIVNQSIEMTSECPTGCFVSSPELMTVLNTMDQMGWFVDVEAGNGAFGRKNESAEGILYHIDDPLPVIELSLDDDPPPDVEELNLDEDG